MKKVLSITIILCVLFVLIAMPVQATGESCSIQITPDKSTLNAGDTVNVTFATRDLNLGNTQGLFMISGKIYLKQLQYQIYRCKTIGK